MTGRLRSDHEQQSRHIGVGVSMPRAQPTNTDGGDMLISAVDLFCGAGGLTHGLLRAGVDVHAGIDIDEAARFAYTTNNPGVEFLPWDVAEKNHTSIARLFRPAPARLLAGCAPCQPFSKLTNGIERHRSWDLLNNFGRFVAGLRPELVTMENVPELANRGRAVFRTFVGTLERAGYWFDWKVVHCAAYGVPQFRRRLVLVASRMGPISVPDGRIKVASSQRTVRSAIAALPPLQAGGEDPRDPIHVASRLSEINMRRIRATPKNGGSRDAWPDRLALDCHRRESGRKYVSIYGRMNWDQPAPTMTTLCNGIGNGRFGHPEQDRAISLREAALLQSFPWAYEFWPLGKKVKRKAVARMIGNAVPPALATALGRALVRHVQQHIGPQSR
jgi:DNA (cytosine-5)-methyltransferase 1